MFLFVFLFFGANLLWAQNGFTLPAGKKEGKIKFELVNNLIVLPVEINKVKLSFILDTGVSHSLLFGATKDTLELKKTSKVIFRGLGGGEPVEALKSSGNIVKVGKAKDQDHTLFVVFDESLNFSPRMGVPIHGILGYDFFKNFIITINYQKKTIRYTIPKNYNKKRLKNYKTYPILIEKRRPFLNNITVNNEQNMLMLIDTGSSDGVWVFNDEGITSEKEKNYFIDFLGLGLSGSIYGKRSRADLVVLGDFNFNKVNVAIPDYEAISKNRLLEGRNGSIGSQIMKRFNVVFDYSENKISLKKNKFFNDSFYYNMSGLTLEHNGVSVVKNRVSSTESLSSRTDSGNKTLFNLSPTYEIFLAPAVVVAEVRENSEAAIAGVEVGDTMISINGKLVYNYKLHQIHALFSSKEGKQIQLKIDRNGVKLTKSFILKKLF